MEVVRVAGLQKVYGDGGNPLYALDNVTFSVEEGEFLVITGSSGSGKTTLLNMLSGLDVPSAGGVWICGSSLKDMEAEERTVFRRRNIGVVFQQYNLIPVIDVYENIVLPLRLDGALIDEGYVEEIAKMLKIYEKLHKMPTELSGGQQQRAAIARALVMKPAVILADEPTGSLDSKTSMEVVGLLKSCSEKFGQTVLMVSHDEDVAQMADRIIRIEDGKIRE
ncbi:ABC transporter ATP-binding protein [Lachnoclostridium sp. An181]|uniref:ABC transporter ATP-binding protein n=1 Tax=Lachnoclostridium sp. An181 TaxID=1965575 RepID=UPI000B37170A|nr:ABC transporter ATP-binding protein [Lachnoclostridium sp. An181]OUP49406.1 ABC transporter ATP-binding protein [Lachnoclostridium sp. An181]